MKAKKIKYWARVGQVSWLLLMTISAIIRRLETEHEITEFSVTDAVCILFGIIGLTFIYLITEAIVRIVINFAEILENKKKE